MGFALIIIGALLITVGLRDQVALFNATLKDDFIGQPGERGNFVFWIVAIFVIAAVGSTNENIKRVSDAFLALVIVTLFLAANRGAQGGLFAQASRQLQE